MAFLQNSFIVKILACMAFTSVGLVAMIKTDDIRSDVLCKSFMNCMGIPLPVVPVEDRLNEDTTNGRVRGDATLPER